MYVMKVDGSYVELRANRLADPDHGVLGCAIGGAAGELGHIIVNPNGVQCSCGNRGCVEALASGPAPALARLLVIVENYPQLKSVQNFSELQAQLEGTENRIAVERRRFNEVVQQYNTKVRTVPTSLIAGMLGFQQRPYFAAEPGATTAPPKADSARVECRPEWPPPGS